MVTITWKRFRFYEEAKNQSKCVYLHEWNGIAYYIGICNTVFGGNKRKIDGKFISPRYASGYSHWINGCLEHGGRLYIGNPELKRGQKLEDVEQTLDKQLTPVKSKKVKEGAKIIDLQHKGIIPLCIRETIDTVSIRLK